MIRRGMPGSNITVHIAYERRRGTGKVLGATPGVLSLLAMTPTRGPKPGTVSLASFVFPLNQM
jgi:hypothetical protein